MDLFRGLPNVVGFIPDPRDSLAEAREIVGPDPVLIGNIDGPTLDKKTAGEVTAACEALLHDRRRDPRFILCTTGPDVPWNTPPENIRALLRSVRNDPVTDD
jgi:uroporphyrinogen decarboxylase